MTLQPGFRLFHVWAKLLAERPEVWAVVHFLQMRNLMGGEVIDHRRWCHDDAPGEAQISFRGAGAPATTGILHGNRADRCLDGAGMQARQSLEIAARLFLEEG